MKMLMTPTALWMASVLMELLVLLASLKIQQCCSRMGVLAFTTPIVRHHSMCPGYTLATSYHPTHAAAMDSEPMHQCHTAARMLACDQTIRLSRAQQQPGTATDSGCCSALSSDGLLRCWLTDHSSYTGAACARCQCKFIAVHVNASSSREVICWCRRISAYEDRCEHRSARLCVLRRRCRSVGSQRRVLRIIAGTLHACELLQRCGCRRCELERRYLHQACAAHLHQSLSLGRSSLTCSRRACLKQQRRPARQSSRRLL